MLVKAGGRLAYITCSLLPEENAERIAAFLKESNDKVLFGDKPLVLRKVQ